MQPLRWEPDHDQTVLAAVILATPLVLWGCVLIPEKFISKLMISADGTFSFACKGEVVAIDPSSAMKAAGESSQSKPTETDASKVDVARPSAQKPDAACPEDAHASNREIAAALSKEAGYRPVVLRWSRLFGQFGVSAKLISGSDHAAS